MITVRRTDNMTIVLSLDNSGLAELLKHAVTATAGESDEISLHVDNSVFSSRRTAALVPASMRIVGAEETEIDRVENRVEWRMATEDLECLVARLRDCQKAGVFTSAELMRVQVAKNKRLDYIIGELKLV